jgi:general secretion pathway protein I
MTARPEPARGFTLIEILVAFAILAFALVALYRIFGGGLATTARLEQRTAALLLARSMLERVGTDVPLVAGEQSGTTADGMAWTLDIRPAGLIAPAEQQTAPVLPFEVAVTVSHAGMSPITLTTLRLASQAPPAEPVNPDLNPEQPAEQP